MIKICVCWKHRDVAQPGSAPASGAGGRWFESSHPDHLFPILFKSLAPFPGPEAGFLILVSGPSPVRALLSLRQLASRPRLELNLHRQITPGFFLIATSP